MSVWYDKYLTTDLYHKSIWGGIGSKEGVGKCGSQNVSRILKDKKELALGDRRKTFQEPGQGRANTDARENKATRSVSWTYGCGV